MAAAMTALDPDLDLHTLALVREFLHARGCHDAHSALHAACPRQKDEPASRDDLLRNLTLTRLVKHLDGAAARTMLELVVDTLLRRSRVLRKWQRDTASAAESHVEAVDGSGTSGARAMEAGRERRSRRDRPSAAPTRGSTRRQS